MNEVGALIADMVKAGVDPELIGRAAEALAHREPVLVTTRSAGADRQARYRERNKASQGVTSDVLEDDKVSPKEVSPEPLQEITPSNPTTHKETPLRGSKKGSRLPDDFEPDFDFATVAGLSPSHAQSEFAKFRDFWAAKCGQGAAKLDWQATWRNWVRSAVERMPKSRAGPPTRVNHAVASVDALMEKLDAITPSETQGNPAYPYLVAYSGNG